MLNEQGELLSVNRAEIEQHIVRTLRQGAMGGSERDISLEEPLGELGLGLDSLAIVGFLVALEKHFEIDLLERIWIERSRHCLADLVDAIMELGRPAGPAFGENGGPPAGIRESAPARAHVHDGPHGFFREISRVAARAPVALSRLLYQRESFHILARDLTTLPLPEVPSPPDIVFRTLGLDDARALNGFWPARLRGKKMRLFEQRLARGYLCLTAWRMDRIVAMDWVSGWGDDEPFTGLSIRTRHGSCLGLDLEEHKLHRGKGIGLALLACSLRESKARGYRRQVTLVQVPNVRMTVAAVVLLGFEKIGELRTRRYLGKPASVWEVNGSRGRGKDLVL